MAWQIRFETKAEKEFSALDNSVKIKILKYLKKLEIMRESKRSRETSDRKPIRILAVSGRQLSDYLAN